jgi:hypothetical protein
MGQILMTKYELKLHLFRQGYKTQAKKIWPAMGPNEGKTTSGIRIQNRLSSKWSTKAAREQKRRLYAG